jgi:hypothetical protein
MNVYDVGDRVRVTATFTNASAVVTDPTTVTVLAKPRYGSPTTYTYPATVTKDSTGVYHVDLDVTAEGIWDYRFVGTGTVVAAADGSFNVRDSQFV